MLGCTNSWTMRRSVLVCTAVAANRRSQMAAHSELAVAACATPHPPHPPRYPPPTPSLYTPQIEKLRLAAEMLPPDEGYQKAARLVEQAMQSAPWTLTDAFVTHFRWLLLFVPSIFIVCGCDCWRGWGVEQAVQSAPWTLTDACVTHFGWMDTCFVWKGGGDSGCACATGGHSNTATLVTVAELNEWSMSPRLAAGRARRSCSWRARRTLPAAASATALSGTSGTRCGPNVPAC